MVGTVLNTSCIGILKNIYIMNIIMKNFFSMARNIHHGGELKTQTLVEFGVEKNFSKKRIFEKHFFDRFRKKIFLSKFNHVDTALFSVIIQNRVSCYPSHI